LRSKLRLRCTGEESIHEEGVHVTIPLLIVYACHVVFLKSQKVFISLSHFNLIIKMLLLAAATGTFIRGVVLMRQERYLNRIFKDVEKM
jgi:hypothetical protein